MKRYSTTVYLLLLLFFMAASKTQAASFFVDSPATLIAAINAANSDPAPDTIIFTSDITLTDVDNTFNGNGPNGLPIIISEITILGNGFTLQRDLSDPDEFRFFYVDELGNLTIDNLTLSGGRVSGFSWGGSIYNDYFGTLLVMNSTITNSTAINGGGMLILSTSKIVNTTISNNAAIGTFVDGMGGGVWHNGGTLAVINSKIIGNSARSGGGIFSGYNLVVNNTTIADNTALIGGGGIFSNYNLNLSNSVIHNNTLTDTVADGGGIYNFGDALITNTTFTSNSATHNGGGVFNSFKDVLLNNNTIVGNIAESGGGVFHDGLGFGKLMLSNNIVAGNTASTSSNCYDVSDEGNNLSETIGTDGCPAGFGDTTPGTDFSLTLADNGGSTETLALIDTGTNPAIDGGGGTPTSIDQRGAAAFGVRDIGAYEYDGALQSVSFTIDEATLYEVGGVSQATVTITTQNYNALFEVYFLFDGSADSNDYTSTYAGPYTINANGNQTFTIDIVSDAIADSPEMLNLTMYIAGAVDLTGANPQSITFIDEMPVVITPEPEPSPESQPSVGIFDPAISKIGLLVPGQVGVTGEQLEWIITVSNTGGAAGQNVTITDTIDSRLSINSVNAPGASVQVNGQTVSVTYPTIDPGQTVQYSIFTTVLAGESVTNTVCIAGTSVCATGLSVGELPQTGESHRP